MLYNKLRRLRDILLRFLLGFSMKVIRLVLRPLLAPSCEPKFHT